MEKYTLATQSKLKRIVKNAEIITKSIVLTDELKSTYNSIKDDWNTLKDDLQEKWIEIKFTNNDFEYDNLCYNKFSEISKTNMQRIKCICEDVLAEISADEKENDVKIDIDTNKKPMLNTGSWLAIMAILVAIILSITTQYQETRYDQGRQEMRNELIDTLKMQQNTIQTLLDSLEKIKLKNAELENRLKTKKPLSKFYN